MKSLYLILPTCLICQPLMAYEEEPYGETPVAVQIADLKDDDLDGVINARDDCPSTPRGALVDNEGCGEKYVHKKLSSCESFLPITLMKLTLYSLTRFARWHSS